MEVLLNQTCATDSASSNCSIASDADTIKLSNVNPARRVTLSPSKTMADDIPLQQLVQEYLNQNGIQVNEEDMPLLLGLVRGFVGQPNGQELFVRLVGQNLPRMTEGQAQELFQRLHQQRQEEQGADLPMNAFGVHLLALVLYEFCAVFVRLVGRLLPPAMANQAERLFHPLQQHQEEEEEEEGVLVPPEQEQAEVAPAQEHHHHRHAVLDQGAARALEEHVEAPVEDQNFSVASARTSLTSNSASSTSGNAAQAVDRVPSPNRQQVQADGSTLQGENTDTASTWPTMLSNSTNPQGSLHP